MPIEFACKACDKLLRVPDGSGGSSCKCPACGTMLSIPKPETVERTAPSNLTSASDKLTIPCPKCQFSLICSPDLLGTKGQCRNCKHIFLIATDRTELASTAAAQTNDLVFTCPKCQQLFEGKEEMQGRKGKCHACGEVFAISLKPSSKLDTAPTKPAVQTPPKPQPFPTKKRVAPALQRKIKIACVNCEGLMEVPASTAGQSTACPYCNQLLKIPSPGRDAVPSPASRPMMASKTLPPSPRPAPPASEFAVQDDIWADLGDLSGAGSLPSNSNPYAAPSATAANSWSAPRGGSRNGLTFSNAFGLTYDLAFPTCMIAAVVYILVVVVNSVIIYGGGALLGFFLKDAGLDRNTALYVLIGFFVFAGIVALCCLAAWVCITCQGALSTIRRQQSDLFSTGGVFVPMLIFLFIAGLLYAAIALIPQGVISIAPNPILFVFASLLMLGLLTLLGFSICLAPYAIIDGEGPLQAMGTSMSIVFGNFPAMLGIVVCGILLHVAITIITCGLGSVLLIGLPFYLNAAAYHLATK